MSGRHGESIARLEEQLDGASRAMSALAQLNAGEAARVAGMDKMDAGSRIDRADL